MCQGNQSTRQRVFSSFLSCVVARGSQGRLLHAESPIGLAQVALRLWPLSSYIQVVPSKAVATVVIMGWWCDVCVESRCMFLLIIYNDPGIFHKDDIVNL